MKFIIKQRIVAFGKQYKVLDESENQVFEISSMLFSPERRKEILDMSGSSVAWSEWPILSTRAELTVSGASCALDIPFISLTPLWTGECAGAPISVTGDFLRLAFTVDKAGETVATIAKRILAFSDTYEVEANEVKITPEFVLLIVALIDHKYHSENA
jgi:uncharacterized protein YxjI